MYSGCSKMSGCKAPEILSPESYREVRRRAKDEGNAADGRFGREPNRDSALCDPQGKGQLFIRSFIPVS